MRLMKSSLLMLAVLFATAAAGIAGPGWENLPLNHWSYAALERFEALGLCDLPSERPFSRPQIILFADQIERRLTSGEARLSPRDRYDLDRLRSEFSGAEALVDPAARYDPPLVYRVDSPLRVEGDLDLAFVPTRAPFDDRTELLLKSSPGIKLHLDSRFTYEVGYALVFGPERGDRARDEKPSKREKSFKGLTSLYERAYLQYRSDHLTLRFGREYVDWGPASRGNLLISSGAGSLDQIGATIRFRALQLSVLHAPLSLERERYLAAHRLEVRWKRLLVGISETAVYAGRGFDPIYALPLASFYANQFNEKGDDNILWSIDLKYRPAAGLIVYGSLLIDDFQFERDDNTPDKLGFDIGGSLALSAPVPATLTAWYRYVDIHTYTHRDSITAHVAGDGLPHTGDPLLGGDPGPDSDSWRFQIRLFPLAAMPVTLGIEGTRRGEGNDFRKFTAGMDPFPPFPSGTVETTLGIDVRVKWELDGGSGLEGFWRWQTVDNRDHIAGAGNDDTSFFLSLLWDL